MLHDVDLILIEGYKQESLPRIGICRAATDKGLPGDVTDYVAVVTDDEGITANAQEVGIPHYDLDDVDGVVALILRIAEIG
jgi:molybdopterin-guanine dinucleotide biosynthesis protein